jgi:hypothetical protein
MENCNAYYVCNVCGSVYDDIKPEECDCGSRKFSTEIIDIEEKYAETNEDGLECI